MYCKLFCDMKSGKIHNSKPRILTKNREISVTFIELMESFKAKMCPYVCNESVIGDKFVLFKNNKLVLRNYCDQEPM